MWAMKGKVLYMTDTAVPATMPHIEELGIQNIWAFLHLRKEIEGEAKHLPGSGGDRKDPIVFTLLRLLANRKHAKTFLAKVDGCYVGYITMVFARFRKFRGNAYIATVSIKAEHRSKGIGTHLMSVAESFAKQRGIRRLELEVFSKNTKAVALYERLGYTVEGRKHNAVEGVDGLDDVLFMAKLLA